MRTPKCDFRKDGILTNTSIRYKDKESADKHTKTEHFQELFKTFEKEGIMAKPPYLAQTSSKHGFDLDHKLI